VARLEALALAVYEAARTGLADELGIDPGADLQGAYLEVLRGRCRERETGGRVAYAPICGPI
jgi:DNA-binding SARP family transcriptional activator